MARETKAQREAREAVERAQREAERKDAYPKEFLTVMSQALNEGFELQSVNPETGVFTFRDYDSGNLHEVLNEYVSYDESDWPLNDLKWAVDRKVEARAEAERQRQLRQSALAKLDPAERAALGL